MLGGHIFSLFTEILKMLIVVELKAVKLLCVPGVGEVNPLYGILGL